MSESPALRLVDSETGEIHEVDRRLVDLEEQIIGLNKTIASQARMIGALEKRVQHDEDPNSHPKGREIVELIERWKQSCHHPNAKVSADRVKLVKARFKDGYSVEELALAIDALAAFPYRVYDKRFPTGRPADRHDQLKDAIGDSERLEKLANLGHQARKEQG